MDELEWFRQAIVRAYPNPERIGCPSPGALEGMARRTVPMGTAEQEHIFHCSPCFSTYLGIRNQIRRQRAIRMVSFWAAAAVLVAVLSYSGYRLFFPAPAPQQFTTAVNMQEHPVFRGIHQAASHPSPFVFPRGIVHLALTLPLGSEPGVYQVQICRDDQTEPLLATSGQAALLSDGSTLLKVNLDTYKLRAGKYALGVRKKEDSEWSYSPLVLP
jgi:hypothetical protein